jgi:hypothetical protein
VLLNDSYHMITMDNERATVARETALFFAQYANRKPAIAAQLLAAAG